jgi:hypothetical protein
MEALAADLRDIVPGLARQFAASRPTVRRNSGFGLFSEMAVDQAPTGGGPSGDLGTVHVMVGNLPDPIAFTARLQDGRLVGLMGDSYGQDTRQIDFTTVPFSQVFTLDDSGRSVPFRSASAEPEPQPRPVPRPAPLTAEIETLRRAIATGAQANPAVANVLQRVQDHARADQSAIMLARTVAPPDAIAPDGAPTTDATSALIGAWAVIGAVAVIIGFLTDLPWPFILVIAIWLGSALRKPKALSALQRGVDSWNASRAN